MLRSSPANASTQQGRRERTGPETGSVAIAMMIMMIIALLGAAALARSQQTLHLAQQLDQRAAAEASAERALAEAISRLNNGEPLPFKGEVELSNGAFYYKVEQTDVETVNISAGAKVDGIYREINAELARTFSQGYSLFTNGWLESHDNQGTISGAIGTNGIIKFDGSEPGDTQEIFSPDGICEECQNLIRSEGPWPTPEVQFPTGPVQKCAGEMVFTEVVDGENGVPFVCDDGEVVIFKGDIKIKNPPLIVYLGQDTALMIYEANVNLGRPASDLQIYVKTNPKERRLFLAQNSNISAIIDAPGRDLSPMDFSLRGSLTVRSLEIALKYSVSIKPDETTVSQQPGDWTITSWEMLPTR